MGLLGVKMKTVLVLAGVLTAVWGGVASAHVVVKPAEAEAAAFQSFTIGVPTEGDSPTVKVRLVVPNGVGHVTPNVKPGWQIDTAKQGSGEDATVKEIIWSAGTIPAGQRDDFVFSAQLPAQTTTVQWKAYQTYANGKTVSWDQAPKAESHDDDNTAAGPYSETKVVESLDNANAAKNDQSASAAKQSNGRNNIAIGISIVALVLAVIALTQDRKSAADPKKK